MRPTQIWTTDIDYLQIRTKEILMTKTKDETPTQPKVAKPKATDLEKLLAKYRDLLIASERDLTEVDAKSRSGHELVKRQALNELAPARTALAEALRRGLAAVFVRGDKELVKDFASIAENEGPAIVVACDGLYVRLAKEIEGAMRQDRQWEPSQHARLLDSLAALCTDMGLTNMPAPKFQSGQSVRDLNELIQLVRKLVREATGDKLNQLVLEREILNAAAKIDYIRNVVPVVVTGASPDEQNGLAAFFNNRTVTADAIVTVTPEAVLDAFSRLRAIIKKS